MDLFNYKGLGYFTCVKGAYNTSWLQLLSRYGV